METQPSTKLHLDKQTELEKRAEDREQPNDNALPDASAGGVASGLRAGCTLGVIVGSVLAALLAVVLYVLFGAGAGEIGTVPLGESPATQNATVTEDVIASPATRE